MTRRSTIFLVTIFLFSFSCGLKAQQEQKFFGQNKVQYVKYKWHFIQSEHFDIYFYEGGKNIAEFLAETAEDALGKIQEDFREYEIQHRVVFILYNSHNHFQQNNVVDTYLPEGTTGVTELLKNRIVLRYEGSYETFRHLIHHELTHAVMNDFIYGGSIQAAIAKQIRVRVPHWAGEGHANYQGDEFNIRNDMFTRDAVLEGYLPPIQNMGGFASYTAGPTIFTYMAEKYGKEKVAEWWTKLRITGSPEAAFQATFGMRLPEFSDQWAIYQRKVYYPDISQMESVKEFAKRVTFHDRDGNFYWMTPTITPNGDKIATLTDKGGYFDVYLISAFDGKVIKKLVSGGKTGDLEELHFLSPGMSWSPDGKKLVFAAKASDNDALLIVDAETGEIEKFKMDKLEGVFGGSWSPDGKKILFSGIKWGQSDIYVFDLEKKKISNLTDDIFTDNNPVFSPDGQSIAFASDRKNYLTKQGSDFEISKFDYHTTDIYTMTLASGEIKRITNDGMNDSWPQYSPEGDKLLFVSDRNGVSNLWVADLTAQKNYAITNAIGGVFQPTLSKDGRLVAFSGFNKAGFDIFTLKKPFSLEPIDLPMTVSLKKHLKKKDIPANLTKEFHEAQLKKKSKTTADSSDVKSVTFSDDGDVDEKGPESKRGIGSSFSKYVFAGEVEPEDEKKKEEEYNITLEKKFYKNDTGDYYVRKYKVKFSPDLIYGTAGFNTFVGFQGITQLSFSDVLGNHRLLFGTSLFFDLKNSSFVGAYQNLSGLTDYSVSAFHTAYSFGTDFVAELGNGVAIPGIGDGFTDSFVRYRYYGATFAASRPINKFKRFDVSVTQFGLARETAIDQRLEDLGITKAATVGPSRQSWNTLLTLGFTKDNSLFTIFGPFDGERSQIWVTTSPGYGEDGLRFTTVAADYRKYFWFNKLYAVATRASAGATFGRNPQRFFVGGLDNWIGPRFLEGDILVNSFEDFLATFVSPVRGSDYYELQGTRYFVSNFEFRFPLIHMLHMGFPLPIFLQSIRGVTFLDIGAAWGGPEYAYRARNSHLRGTLITNRGREIGIADPLENDSDNEFRLTQTLPGERTWTFQNARMGWGFGIRAFLGFFVLRYDLAWNIKSPRFYGNDAKHYFSLGYDF